MAASFLISLVASNVAVRSGADLAPKPSVLAGKAIRSTAGSAGSAGVPTIPNQFYAEVIGNTTGTVAGIPYGQSDIKQWYDFDDKLVRLDRADGTTKMYDYKTLVDPCPVGNCPGQPKFPTPQGFKFRTGDINNTCCWTWLIDSDTQEPETMEKFEVESNAKLVGTDARGEHWLSVKRFPFLQTDDWWFTAPNSSYPDGILVASNSYFLIKGHTSVSGYVMSNGTYNNVKYGTVDKSVFAHPDSRPTFGQCKQCGVDDECPMWECMQ